MTQIGEIYADKTNKKICDNHNNLRHLRAERKLRFDWGKKHRCLFSVYMKSLLMVL